LPGVYNKNSLNVLGKIIVIVNNVEECTLFVVKEDGPSLLGCDWLLKIKFNWKNVVTGDIKNVVKKDNELEKIIDKLG
jgi:hypothetical protein